MSTSTPDAMPLGQAAVNAVVVSSVLLGLATMLVAVRFYIRYRMCSIQPSDWMILLALMFSIVFAGLFMTVIAYGLGSQDLDITLTDYTRQKKLFWISIPFYNATMVVAKGSIIAQYFKVFTPIPKMRVICLVTAVILAIYGAWNILSAFFNCIPFSSLWNISVSGHCLAYNALWYSNTALNITTDVVIVVIPIFALPALNVTKKEKISLVCLFALGGFVCITSICRLCSLIRLLNTVDPSYHVLIFLMWSAIECNTGIISACLPTLRPPIFHDPAASARNRNRNLQNSEENLTSLYDVSSENGGITAAGERDTHVIARESQPHRTSFLNQAKTESDMMDWAQGGIQQQRAASPYVGVMTVPGNAFAQTLAQKGSLFEPVPAPAARQ